MMEGAYTRWPDLHVSVEAILAEGDKVMVRNEWTGTEALSGNKIEFHGFVLWRFANGKIVSVGPRSHYQTRFRAQAGHR